MPRSVITFVLALALAGMGGFAANSVGITGGWLLGALIMVFTAGAFGMPLALPGWLRSITMGFAGITVGAAITAETAELVSLLPLTLGLMFVFLAAQAELVMISRPRDRPIHIRLTGGVQRKSRPG